MNRTIHFRTTALLAVTGLVAAVLALTLSAAPADAGCAGTTTLAGTITGEDGRFVNALVGVDVHDADGNRLRADGCVATGPAGYAATTWINSSLGPHGADSGNGLTTTWSVSLPSNSAVAFVEVYPKGPDGTTSPDRYGHAMRHEIPVSTGVDLRLPLNCGISHNGVVGSNGTIAGTTTLNGVPKQADRVVAWSLLPDTEAQIRGFSIGRPAADGSYEISGLESDQHYSVFVTVAGATQRYLWVPVTDCAETTLDYTFPNQQTLVIPDATFFVANTLQSGPASTTTVFGMPGDEPVVGDWDGNNHDDIGVRRGKSFAVRYGVGPGYPSAEFSYGVHGDELFIGDWDGNGTDTLVVRRGNLFFLRNDLRSGPAHTTLGYGRPGDEVFVGDWDGDGTDTLAVRRGNVFFLRNDLRSGPAHIVMGYGRAGDEVFVGDWDGDGTDTLAVRRGNTYYLRNDLRSGPAHTVLSYGYASDTVLVGDWNADGIDTFAVHR